MTEDLSTFYLAKFDVCTHLISNKAGIFESTCVFGFVEIIRLCEFFFRSRVRFFIKVVSGYALFEMWGRIRIHG